jgi:multiple sugar transport system permease protein
MSAQGLSMNKFIPGQRALLFIGSLLFSLYVLAPIAWLLSSSLQSEAEITSVPPHWVPHAPTAQYFRAFFKAPDV